MFGMPTTQEDTTAPGPPVGLKACVNCARVKCKCIRRADGTSCERCQRLNKECTPAVVARRRGAKRAPASRVARVEEKLDDLVSLLKLQQKVTGSSPSNDAVDDQDVGITNDETEHNEPEPSRVTPPAAVSTPIVTNSKDGSVISSGGVSTPASDFSLPYEPSPSEAEESVRKFREETVALFPFVYLPPHVTSQTLRELYPFLWLNIISTTSTSPRRRVALGDYARSIIFQKVVVEREKSLDLLLGMLVYVTWSHLQQQYKLYAPLFSQLIITLVGDLSLHRPVPPENARIFCTLRDSSGERSNEERRIALGAFALTSMTSFVYKGAGGLRWSPCFEDYLTHLDRTSTVAQDRTLIAQVKLQLILEQIQHAPWTATNGVIPPLYLSALRSQLHEITKRENKYGTVVSHPIIMELSHFTELMIYESAISKLPAPCSEPGLERFEIYQGCLASINAWLNAFFSTPFAVFHSRTYASYFQLVRVMVCLHNITTLQDPAWDGAAVRKVVDLIPTLDKIIGTFEQLAVVSALLSPDGGENETYTTGVSIFQKMKTLWHGTPQTSDTANYTGEEPSSADDTAQMPIDLTKGCIWLSSEFDNITWV